MLKLIFLILCITVCKFNYAYYLNGLNETYEGLRASLYASKEPYAYEVATYAIMASKFNIPISASASYRKKPKLFIKFKGKKYTLSDSTDIMYMMDKFFYASKYKIDSVIRKYNIPRPADGYLADLVASQSDTNIYFMKDYMHRNYGKKLHEWIDVYFPNQTNCKLVLKEKSVKGFEFFNDSVIKVNNIPLTFLTRGMITEFLISSDSILVQFQQKGKENDIIIRLNDFQAFQKEPDIEDKKFSCYEKNGCLVVAIQDFTYKAADSILYKMKEVEANNSLLGINSRIIIDLRNSYGGPVQEIKKFVETFFDFNYELFSLEFSNGEKLKFISSNRIYKNRKIRVLINNKTTSGSLLCAEILDMRGNIKIIGIQAKKEHNQIHRFWGMFTEVPQRETYLFKVYYGKWKVPRIDFNSETELRPNIEYEKDDIVEYATKN